MQPLFSCKPNHAPGRWAVGPLVMFACLSNLGVPQAHAGTWEVSLTLTRIGTYTETHYNPQTGQSTVITLPLSATEENDVGNVTNHVFDYRPEARATYYTAKGSAVAGQTAKAEIEDECDVKLRWAPDEGETLQTDPPSENIVLLLCLVTTAKGQTRDVNNSFGSPKDVVELEHDNSTYLATSGSRTLLLNNTGRRAEINLGTMSANCVATSTDGSKVQVTTETSASAGIDTRSVTLSRSDAPVPKKESDVGFNAARDEWVGADGTGHGHTLASYKDRVLLAPMNPFDFGQASDEGRDVLQTLVATHSVTWSPAANLTYQWNPASIGVNNPNSAIFRMPRSNAINNPEGIGLNLLSGHYETDATARGWINTPSDKSKTVVNYQYDLTDQADGATATAKYELMLHDEWENKTPDSRYPATGATETLYWVPPGATPVFKNNAVTYSTSNETTSSVKFKAFFKGGFDLGDWGSAGGSFEAERTFNATYTWATGAPDLADTYPDYDVENVKYLPVVTYTGLRVYHLYDHFGTNGYLPDASTANDNTLAVPLRGMTSQSKIEDIQGGGVPNWWPFDVGDGIPAEGSSDTWYKSGSAA